MSEHKLPALIDHAPLTAKQIAEKMATGHSVFGPSGAEMTMTCLESLALNAVAEDTTSYEAAEGTVAHSMGELWLKTRERPDNMVGEIIEIKGHEIEITEEMIEFVGDFVDACDRAADGADEHFAEQHVDISDLTPIPDQGGTLDFCAFRWQEMTIIDLKYGKEPVFAFYPEDGTINKQLAIYAWGVFLAWDWLYNFQKITLQISQPRLPFGFSTHTITREELIAFADFARERWALAWTINPGRTPSIKGCRWCSIRGKCPALYLFMSEDVEDIFDNWDDNEDDVIDLKPISVSYKRMKGANKKILDKFEPTPFPKLPVPAELSTKAMEKLLRYRKMMDTYFNAILQELLDRSISREEELTWWKLVLSRTRRKWVEDEEFVVDTLVAAGLKPRHLYKTTMLSPAEMERMLHTKLKMSLAKAKTLLQESGLTVQPPGQKTLALTSDARKQLPKDSDVFENWDADDDDII